MKIIKVSIAHSSVVKLFKEVAVHELPVLQQVHTEGQVNPESRGRDDRRPIPNIENEYSRLIKRYGTQAVMAVYGPLSSGRLEEAINKANRQADSGHGTNTPGGEDDEPK